MMHKCRDKAESWKYTQQLGQLRHARILICTVCLLLNTYKGQSPDTFTAIIKLQQYVEQLRHSRTEAKWLLYVTINVETSINGCLHSKENNSHD